MKTNVAEAVTNTKQKTLVCIVGPTAAGKTAMAISLAKIWQSEIISADSRQFYREMHIGTAKPSAAELNDVHHHFVGFLSVDQYYSAGDFERDALAKISELFQVHDVVFLVGGSGLFIQAVCRGMDNLPVVDESTRTYYNQIYAEQGLPVLQALLLEKDPAYYAEVDIQNPQRLIRALEVIDTTGRPFSAYREKNWVERAFQICTIGIDLPRAELYARINARVDAMMAAGLESEARELLPKQDAYALQTVGYTELFRFFKGEISRDEVVSAIKQNTRRYAKRQLTWFRRNADTGWFHPDDLHGAEQFIRKKRAENA